MPDFRAYAPSQAPDAAEILLSPEESHHLVAVNRAGAGDPVVAFDGRGREWTTELAVADRRAARLRVRSGRQAAALPCALALAQAMPKGDGMDAIVRKATEIGAARIFPLQSERTQGRVDAERAERKLAKWRAASIEAAKQCGNPWLPEIAPIEDLIPFLSRSGALFRDSTSAADAGPPPLRVVASLHPGAVRLAAALEAHRPAQARPGARAVCLVGPEGDFTREEIERAIAAGFVPITLGPLVLRCETAAVYALSVLSHELAT